MAVKKPTDVSTATPHLLVSGTKQAHFLTDVPSAKSHR
jgi:hypothetical protein